MVGVEAGEQGNLHDGHCGLSIALEPGNFRAPVSLPPAYPSPMLPLPSYLAWISALASSWVSPSLLCSPSPKADSFNKQESDMSYPCLATFTKHLVSPFHLTFSHPSLHLIALRCQSLSFH